MRVVGTTSAVGYAFGARDRRRAMKRHEGKIAIVTGGGRGLGYGRARRLAREGATIAIAKIDDETGPIKRAEIEKYVGVPVVFPRKDIEHETDAQTLFDAGYDKFRHSDILVTDMQSDVE